ncbi:hypothetical protein [Ileibacterium valens]|nr:hypothetical protein [Ileibacterium valens]
MNKFISRLLGFGTSLLIFVGLNTTVFAEELTIHFSGQDQGFTLDTGESIDDLDLFSGFKNVMPGDTLTQTITITNKNKDSDYIALYLEIQEHDDVKNPLSNHPDNNEESAESMKQFTEQLTLRLVHNGELIFEGAPHVGNTSIKLGDFEPNEMSVITAELIVPHDMGNDFANRFGEVAWRFTAEGLDRETGIPTKPNKPGKPGKPADTSTGTNASFWLVSLITAGLIIVSWYKKRDRSSIQ